MSEQPSTSNRLRTRLDYAQLHSKGEKREKSSERVEHHDAESFVQPDGDVVALDELNVNDSVDDQPQQTQQQIPEQRQQIQQQIPPQLQQTQQQTQQQPLVNMADDLKSDEATIAEDIDDFLEENKVEDLGTMI